MPALTISLMHPTQPVAMHSWTFEPDRDEPIRIGRSHDNDIVVYSSVVSRHHAELWPSEEGWNLKGFGSNGTFVNQQLVTQDVLEDGSIVRLGNSGPRLRIRLGVSDPKAKLVRKCDRKLNTELSEADKHSTFINTPQMQSDD
ncbi:FHA domain-containing protein [Roseofilum reptotaenium CS-1145]|uniref:FHA domain-containing protein n=1 Tax=Roseofilum reptotaenium AO1-A TaxID=1925591 RepID=A0A1L9QTK4_9CYAN|nr:MULTISPECIES: FHA domain-containing protein [Roseofilum]MBP0028377.1 FHA domain-containing protein [Roseofilum sp. Guam]MDB9518989.1 FHA domain-containing protein [Roseofilum reptotaenium CS-1145]OJJ25993.1 hypothetical protein BI308_08525 [Roseofilum reptotaenium AO1-A]